MCSRGVVDSSRIVWTGDCAGRTMCLVQSGRDYIGFDLYGRDWAYRIVICGVCRAQSRWSWGAPRRLDSLRLARLERAAGTDTNARTHAHYTRAASALPYHRLATPCNRMSGTTPPQPNRRRHPTPFRFTTATPADPGADPGYCRMAPAPGYRRMARVRRTRRRTRRPTDACARPFLRRGARED